MMNWNQSWSAGNWAAMSLMMLVLWSLIAVAVIALVRSLRSRRPTPSGDDAVQILDLRLARGDITEAQYAYSRELLHTS
jgi:uncharacterized membrane protein